jgi:hypothetical protein
LNAPGPICFHHSRSAPGVARERLLAMRLGFNLLGSLVMLVGLVWALQGANILPGSFMSGQSFWLYAGGIVTVAGVSIIVWNNLRSD